MNKAFVVAVTLLSVWVGTASADNTASGSFNSKSVKMKAQTAMAFPGHSILDSKMDVIVVAVTSADMDQTALAAYYDRRRAIDQRIKDDDNPVVFFEFLPNGNYRGYSFYFASGNGCGFCGGNMGITNTVKLASGRLAGTLKGTDTDRAFDLKLDVPVTSDDHGAPLPADGGAPGKAYMAYHDALVKRDAKAFRSVLSDDVRKIMDGAAKEGKTGAYLDYLARSHPTQSVRIVKGFSNGKQAVLLLDGESSVIKLIGEAILVNQDGTWRVEDELTDVKMN